MATDKNKTTKAANGEGNAVGCIYRLRTPLVWDIAVAVWHVVRKRFMDDCVIQ